MSPKLARGLLIGAILVAASSYGWWLAVGSHKDADVPDPNDTQVSFPTSLTK